MKKKNALYEEFHKDRRLQKKIIDDNNFTYYYLIRLLKPYLSKVKHVLDIGSGVGTIDFYLASKGIKVTGLEISEQAVELAKKNAKLFGLEKKITFINAAFPSKVPQNKYDLVILSEVLEHLRKDIEALRDIRQVLKPAGILIITTPSQNAPLYRLGLLNKFDHEVGHLRRYSLIELLNILEKNGYTIIASGKQEGLLRNFFFTKSHSKIILKMVRGGITNIIIYVDKLFLYFFGESNIYIIATKTH
ncbi:MAG TPA: class I SAM-dependent methyltransferase [Patescibacteria group bacterium]|nr:class I SAM-dependent methyltransferase [Patescibacteria group bacterium]